MATSIAFIARAGSTPAQIGKAFSALAPALDLQGSRSIVTASFGAQS
jgi:hypothetical protein